MGAVSRRPAKPAPGLLHGAFIVGPGNAALRAVLEDFTAEIDRAVGHVVELRVIGDPATSGPNAKAEDAAAGRRLARAKSSYGRSVAAHGTAERATSEEEADARRRLGLSLDELPILRLYRTATGQSRNVTLRGVPFGSPDVDRGFGHLLVDAFAADRVNTSLTTNSVEAFDAFVDDVERRIALVAALPPLAAKAVPSSMLRAPEANVTREAGVPSYAVKRGEGDQYVTIELVQRSILLYWKGDKRLFSLRVGFKYLVLLLRHPNRAFTARQMMDAIAQPSAAKEAKLLAAGKEGKWNPDGGFRVDERVLTRVVRRVRELRNSVIDKVETKDMAGAESDRDAMNRLLAENDLELRGDGWVVPIRDPALRQDQNTVAKRVNEAVEAVRREWSPVGAALVASIKTEQGANRFAPEDSPIRFTFNE